MDFLHSGSSLLNLILTGNVANGWPLGRVSNIIGDRSSGKTLLAIEAATLFLLNPPKGITPKVHYYEAESAFDQEYAAVLGMPVERVDFIDVEDKTVQHLFQTMEKICDNARHGEGHLFVLDSLDAITSDEELDQKFDDNKTFGMAKQKKMGELFKKLVGKMHRANMHLMVISQIRENISSVPFAPKFRRSGGKALDFYASHLVWLAETAKLKTSTKVVYGANCHAKVTKNKVGKNYREADFPLIYSFGIDEIYSVIKFLSSDEVPTEFRIKKLTAGKYAWKGMEAKINELVAVIEAESSLYTQLISQLQQAWDAIEEEATVARMSKAAVLIQHRDNLLKPPPPKIAFTRRQVIEDEHKEEQSDDIKQENE